MKRIAIPERENWREVAESVGFGFHEMYGEPYWVDGAAYAFSLAEIEEAIEAPSQELHDMCMGLVGDVVRDQQAMERLQVPEDMRDLVAASWQRGDKHLYGRFDLAYDGTGPAKLLEYNADTPTSLYESAAFQWQWLEDQLAAGVLPEGADQFNGIHEALVARFAEVFEPDSDLHFTAVAGNPEDYGTVEAMGWAARIDDASVEPAIRARAFGAIAKALAEADEISAAIATVESRPDLAGAAIDRALEGPDARSVLAEEVRRAEAEAAGAAGVGRLMRLLEERLGSDRVARAFGPEVILDDGVELDLGRVLRATEDESEAAAVQAMDKLVSMLPGRGGAGLAWEEIEARLVPRLVAPGFVARLGAEGRGALAARALFGGALEVTLVLAYDDRARYLRDDELDAARCSLDDALALAARNLAARSEGARFARVDTGDGPIVVARSGDGLDGARLLLPTLHDVLSTELGSPFLAAVPHRDALWASADSPALAEALRARVAEDAARAPHAISAALFRVDARGVRPR